MHGWDSKCWRGCSCGCGCRCGPAARAPRRAISVSARRVATWQSSVAEPCYACSIEWPARWIASLRSQRPRFVSARRVATWQSSVAECCYACSTVWFVRWIAALRSQRLRLVSARRVAAWQSSVAEPCYACSTEWFVRWIASLRSQRLRFVSARHVLQPRLSAGISVAQQQSAYLCSPNDQTAAHTEYHRHHHPFWYSGNYAKRTPLHHKNSFASNAAYRHSGKMALAQTSSCAV